MVRVYAYRVCYKIWSIARCITCCIAWRKCILCVIHIACLLAALVTAQRVGAVTEEQLRGVVRPEARGEVQRRLQVAGGKQ